MTISVGLFFANYNKNPNDSTCSWKIRSNLNNSQSNESEIKNKFTNLGCVNIFQQITLGGQPFPCFYLTCLRELINTKGGNWNEFSSLSEYVIHAKGIGSSGGLHTNRVKFESPWFYRPVDWVRNDQDKWWICQRFHNFSSKTHPW